MQDAYFAQFPNLHHDNIEERERERRRNLYRLYVDDDMHSSPFPSLSPIDWLTGRSSQPYPDPYYQGSVGRGNGGSMLIPQNLTLPPAAPMYPSHFSTNRDRETWF
jgi:hypothetical protein